MWTANPRIQQALRSTLLLLKLRGERRGLSIDALAEELGMQVQQIRNDFAVLQGLGYDVRLSAQLHEEQPQELVSFDEIREILESFGEDKDIRNAIAVLRVARKVCDVAVAVKSVLAKRKQEEEKDTLVARIEEALREAA